LEIPESEIMDENTFGYFLSVCIRDKIKRNDGDELIERNVYIDFS
jgi:hypothetical protein